LYDDDKYDGVDDDERVCFHNNSMSLPYYPSIYLCIYLSIHPSIHPSKQSYHRNIITITSTRQPKHTFDDIKKMQQLFLDTSDIPEEFEINSTKIWNINYLGCYNHHNHYYYNHHLHQFHHFIIIKNYIS